MLKYTGMLPTLVIGAEEKAEMSTVTSRMWISQTVQKK